MEYDWSCSDTRRRASVYYNIRVDVEWDKGRSRTPYIKKMISEAGLTNYKKLKRQAGDCKTNL